MAGKAAPSAPPGSAAAEAPRVAIAEGYPGGGASPSLGLPDVPLLVQPPAAPPTMAATLALLAGAPQAQATSVSQSPNTSDQARIAHLEGLCVMLEERVRELEASAYYSVAMPIAHPAVTDTLDLVSKYSVAVRLDNMNHGLGPLTPLLAAGFLKALARYGLPSGADAGLQAKYVGIVMLACEILSQDADQIGAWFTHFSVRAHYNGGQPPTMATISFKVIGTVSLPMTPQEMHQSVVAVNTAYAGGDDAAMMDLKNRCFTMEALVPTALGVKQHQVMDILRALLCGVGATLQPHRAPAGPGVRDIKLRRGRGRGRGGRGAGGGAAPAY